MYRNMIPEILVMLAFMLTAMFTTAILMATQDAKNGTRTRKVRISSCGVDENGQKTVTVWAKRSVYLPFVPDRVIYVRVPAPGIYELINAYGPAVFMATYERKRCLFVVTDRYVDIEELPEDETATTYCK